MTNEVVFRQISAALRKSAPALYPAYVNDMAGLHGEIERLREEVEVLRLYGNKDCTAMADAELRRRRSPVEPPGQS